MLTRRTADPATIFGRRDLTRLLTGAVVFVAAMTAIFALDLIPQRLVIEVGDVATSDILAPRADSYVSALQTQVARDKARAAVEPVYDYGEERADRVATQQAAAFERLVKPIDDAFKPEVKDADRPALLDAIEDLTGP